MVKYIDYDVDLHGTYAKGRQLAPDVVRMWMDVVSRWIDRGEVSWIMDLGAGTGRFSLPLAEALQAEVMAIDPSRRMLQGVADGVHAVVGMAEALPVSRDSFDLVFASMVLHHITDLDVAASEIARVLRRGGSLMIRTCFSESLDAPYQRFFPSLVNLERELLQSRSDIVHTFGRHGFSLANETRLRQRMDESQRAYAERIRQRAMSPLRLISDAEFAEGMAALDRVAREEDVPVPVFESIDLIHFGN